MSGIAGVINGNGAPIASGLLDAMVAATGHIGIDGVKRLERDTAGLIRFELATTPEAVGQFQIAEDTDSGLAIVFDGRLDNRADLLTTLGSGKLGSKATDCAIVLAAFQKMGDEFLNHLVGDYALAIWNPSRRRLICARSPVGWRPLLWTLQHSRFAFATEPATLVRGLELERQLNEGAIGEHLSARFVTETDTFWDGVFRLPPGHALSFEKGAVRTWQWHIGPFEDNMAMSDADHVSRFQELFDQALVATLRSAGPVAAHLSGGLDSSTVVCRSHQLVAMGKTPEMVSALSVRFPGEICDEGEWIAAVEAQCGIESEGIHGAPFDPGAMAQWCRQTLHLPLRPNTAGTIMATSDRLRDRGIRVLLTGEGGDDWLNGSFGHWPDLLMAGHLAKLVREGLSSFPQMSVMQSLRSTLSQSIGPLVSKRRRERILRPHLDFSAALPSWINPDWAEHAGLAERWQAAPQPPHFDSIAMAKRHHVYSVARRHVNIDNVLCYAASRGVELRHPFHDLRLTHFLMGAAGGMLRRHGKTKYLLREAMRGTLPEVIRSRTTKANISAPIIDGVTASLRERPISELECVKRGWVNASELEKAQAEHVEWRNTNDVSNIPSAPYAPVWNAIAIDMWLENAACQ